MQNVKIKNKNVKKMRKFKKANTILFKLLTLFLKFFFKEGIEFAVDKLAWSEVTNGISAF